MQSGCKTSCILVYNYFLTKKALFMKLSHSLLFLSFISIQSLAKTDFDQQGNGISFVDSIVISTDGDKEIMRFPVDTPDFSEKSIRYFFGSFKPIIKICFVSNSNDGKAVLASDGYAFSFDLGDMHQHYKAWDSGTLVLAGGNLCVQKQFNLRVHGSTDRFRLNAMKKLNILEIEEYKNSSAEE